MSRYRKIEVRTWSDEKFRELSPLLPSGQALWFFLLTGPHTGPVPGLFRAGPAAMAEDLRWSPEAFEKAFAEVSARGMVKADFEARLVWLPKAIRHNKPASPNVVRSWRVELDVLPGCDLKAEAVESLREYLSGLGEAYLAAFSEAAGELPRGRAANGKPSRKALAMAMPNQEQEQEQEQEKKASHSRSSRAIRLPEDWELPEAWRQWAESERPDLDPAKEGAKFRDYWCAKAGNDARKADWQATWRNWIRNARPGTVTPKAGEPGGGRRPL